MVANTASRSLNTAGVGADPAGGGPDESYRRIQLLLTAAGDVHLRALLRQCFRRRQANPALPPVTNATLSASFLLMVHFLG